MRWLSSVYVRLGRVANILLLGASFVPRMRHVVRSRALVIADAREVLLVRSWLGYQLWGLPGGGIKPHESSATAASREVLEESGIRVHPDRFVGLGTFTNNDSTVPFLVDCQLAHIALQPTHIVARRRHEILDAAWFPLSHLPEARSGNVDEALELYRRTK